MPAPLLPSATSGALRTGSPPAPTVLGRDKLKALNTVERGRVTQPGVEGSHVRKAFTCRSVREGRTAIVTEGSTSILYMMFKKES